MKRVFLIVLDSFGIGQMPDADKFGDFNVNTLGACATSSKLHIPNMEAAGLGNIDGVTCLKKAEKPTGAYARLTEASMGKDTTIGHWEIAGVISPDPLPTYPQGRMFWMPLRRPQAGAACAICPTPAPRSLRTTARSSARPASGSSTPLRTLYSR